MIEGIFLFIMRGCIYFSKGVLRNEKSVRDRKWPKLERYRY